MSDALATTLLTPRETGDGRERGIGEGGGREVGGRERGEGGGVERGRESERLKKKILITPNPISLRSYYAQIVRYGTAAILRHLAFFPEQTSCAEIQYFQPCSKCFLGQRSREMKRTVQLHHRSEMKVQYSKDQ